VTPSRSLTAAGVCLGAGLFTTTGYTVLYVDEAVGASIAFDGLTLLAAVFVARVVVTGPPLDLEAAMRGRA
jgi:hypothetical protein